MGPGGPLERTEPELPIVAAARGPDGLGKNGVRCSIRVRAKAEEIGRERHAAAAVFREQVAALREVEGPIAEVRFIGKPFAQRTAKEGGGDEGYIYTQMPRFAMR